VGVSLGPCNYDAMLIEWSKLALEPSVSFDAGSSIYSLAAEAARNAIRTNFG